MSDILNSPRTATSLAIEAAQTSYMDWGAVVAGALVGIAVIAVMTTFGSAVGLSLASPMESHGFAASAIAVAAAIWTMWIVISGYVVAGYIAGRIRHIGVDTSPEEAEIRNGAHGLVAWAITTIAVASLTTFVVSSGSHALGNKASPNSDRTAYVADELLRGSGQNGTYQGGTYNDGLRREVASILRNAALPGGVSADDKAYLVRLVSAGGPVGEDANGRVVAAIAEIKANADAVRKTGILFAFLTAASLAVGAAAAWAAAKLGGAHRLDYRGISALTRWR